MQNVMAAAYPSMFQAAIVYSGVPAACFYSASGAVNGWNGTCSQGNSIHSQSAWADEVFKMYPSYTGNRPRMQIYHGSADTILYPQNWNETVKQWTGVFGYSDSALQTNPGVPGGQYTTYYYGPKVIGVYGSGVGHTVPVMGAEDMKFFCLDGSCEEGYDEGNSGSSTTTTNSPGTTTTSTSTAQSPTPTQGNCSARWAQCGGNGWTGATCCVNGTTCTYLNDWYSQCL